MDRGEEGRRLQRIRERVGDVGQYLIEVDTDGTRLIRDDGDGDTTLICEFAGRSDASIADIEFLAGAADDVRFLLGLIDRAVAAIRLFTGTAPPPTVDRNYAAECAIKCGEPAFAKYLEERHGLARPLTKDRVAARVRSVLAISSRAELNADAKAAARWRMLKSNFEDWKRGRI